MLKLNKSGESLQNLIAEITEFLNRLIIFLAEYAQQSKKMSHKQKYPELLLEKNCTL
jgi:hypothetical protein